MPEFPPPSSQLCYNHADKQNQNFFFLKKDTCALVMHHLQALLHHLGQFRSLINSQSAEAENAWGAQGHSV